MRDNSVRIFAVILLSGLAAACATGTTDQQPREAQAYHEADGYTNPAGTGDFGTLDDVPMNYLPSALGK